MCTCATTPNLNLSMVRLLKTHTHQHTVQYNHRSFNLSMFLLTLWGVGFLLSTKVVKIQAIGLKLGLMLGWASEVNGAQFSVCLCDL